MEPHGLYQEPRPPSFPPQTVIQQRTNIWDVFRTVLIGCFTIVFLAISIPFIFIFIPKIIEFFSNANMESLSAQMDVPDVWLKRYVYGIIAAIIIGLIIRIIRKRI